jgi:hypothetical protein
MMVPCLAGMVGGGPMIKFVAIMVVVFIVLPQILGGLSNLTPSAPPPTPSGLTIVDYPACSLEGMPLPDGHAGRLESMGVDRDGGQGAMCRMFASRCYAAWKVACVDLETDAGREVEARIYVPDTLAYQPQFAAAPDPVIDPTFNCHGFTFASTLGRFWINDPSTILEDLYAPVDASARRAGDVVMYESGGIYVHSARLDSVAAEPWRDVVVHKPGKVPAVKRQLRGPGPGVEFAWEAPATVTYHRRR